MTAPHISTPDEPRRAPHIAWALSGVLLALVALWLVWRLE